MSAVPMGRWFPPVAAVLCVPPLFALVWALGYAEHQALLTGDPAAFELRVIEATRFAQTLGPYSRFGWQHPGPLYFYLLSPLYVASGGTSLSLYLGAGLLNAVAFAALLWWGARAAPAAWHRFVLVLGLCVWSLWFVDVHLPVTWTEIWNPVSTLLPFSLLLLTAGLVGAGQVQWLPLACALHALVVQSHVGYALVASTAVGVGCVLLGLRRRQAPVAGLARAFAVSAAVIVLLWLPALWDQVAGEGNLGRLALFFTAERATAPLGSAFGWALVRVQSPLLQPFELTAPRIQWIAGALCLVQGGLLLWGAARRSRVVASALCRVVLCVLPVALWAATRVDDARLGYLVHWLSVVGMWGWIAVGWALLPEGGDRSAAVLSACVALATTGLQVASIAREQSAFAHHGLDEAKEAARLLPAVRQELARHPGAPLWIGSHDAWGVVGGVILQLVKSGERPRVQQDWRFMFGGAVDYVDDREGAMLFAEVQPRGSVKVVEAGRYDLYVDGNEADARMLRLGLVSAGGAHGDAGRVTDGFAPPEGAPWDVQHAVVLDATAVLTLALPDAPVRGLRLLADGNDTYAVEGSYDGVSFVALGSVPSNPKWGLAARDFLFRRGELFRFVRIRPGRGDGSYSVAEVWALSAPGYLIEPGKQGQRGRFDAGFGEPESNVGHHGVWVVGTEATLVVSLQAHRPAEIRFAMRAYELIDQRQRVRIELGGRALGSFELGTALQTYWVHVPPELAVDQTRITLRFDHAEAPAARGESLDTRPLSAWLERVAVVVAP